MFVKRKLVGRELGEPYGGSKNQAAENKEVRQKLVGSGR
jgi:hypothetical protein